MRIPLEMIYPSLINRATLDRLRQKLDPSLSNAQFHTSWGQRLRQAEELRAAPAFAPLDAAPPELPATSREHDKYFEVSRVAVEPAAGFLRALIIAHLEAPLDCVAQETGGWDDSPRLLFEGLAHLYGTSGETAPVLGDPDPNLAPDPMTTWLAGHRLFFTLEQGAVVGLRHAIGAPDAEGCARGLRFASAFLRSSAGAMRLASAFDPQRYIDEVRPDMAPPKVQEGFSGLYTVDHRELVRAMVAWRAVPVCPAVVAESEELVEAVRTVYLSHEFVCERFRGGHMPSLRSEAAVQSDLVPPSGVALAREFTRRRVNALIRAADSP